MYSYLHEVWEMLHHIELALSIADKGVAGMCIYIYNDVSVKRNTTLLSNVYWIVCHCNS